MFITKFSFFAPLNFIFFCIVSAVHCNCIFRNRTNSFLKLFKLPKVNGLSFKNASKIPPFLFYEMR
ncbi:hypothetical protein CYJ41_00210 [Campylobacter ureolyticus]|uniref:Uncharacterized protein n=1 Tax=Campylobacter ureolyticus TaxID=827 RepID=A0A2I1NC12_9BACT|nr:hypothetical protein CYJ41_00210 [Campylobacter ureolyticus]